MNMSAVNAERNLLSFKRHFEPAMKLWNVQAVKAGMSAESSLPLASAAALDQVTRAAVRPQALAEVKSRPGRVMTRGRTEILR